MAIHLLADEQSTGDERTVDVDLTMTVGELKALTSGGPLPQHIIEELRADFNEQGLHTSCDAAKPGMTDSSPTDLVGLALPVDPERDAIESRLSDDLRTFLQQHDRCNVVRDGAGKITSTGARIYSGELDSNRRQCAECAECSAVFVGPSYAWLNRGVRLTRFGQLLKHGSVT